jgi:trigger factor
LLSFETEPQLPSIDFKQIQLKKITRPEINDEKVEEMIKQIQLFFAEWKTIEGQPVKEGNFVLLDVDVIEEDPPVKLFSDTRFEVSDKSMAQWMKSAVLGMHSGESKEAISIPDENAKAEEKEELKPKKVKITLKAVEDAKVPSIDDAFAQKLGVANCEDLRKTITELLNKQADTHVKEKLREQVSELVLTQYPFELPVSLTEKETHFRMKQLLQDPQFQNHWNKMQEDERKKMIESVYQQAEKAVRMFYLCRKVIADAKLTITSQDLPHAPTSALEALMFPQPWHSNEHSEVRQAETYSRLVLEKAEDYIISQALQV